MADVLRQHALVNACIAFSTMPSNVRKQSTYLQKSELMRSLSLELQSCFSNVCVFFFHELNLIQEETEVEDENKARD